MPKSTPTSYAGAADSTQLLAPEEAAVAAQQESIPWNEVKQIEEEASANERHLLIVDDEESLRWLMQKKLEGLGFVVDVAACMESAIKYISRKHYDAIILDNFLDDGNGIDLIPQIIAISPMTKIIMLTAYGTIEMAVKAMNEGASALCLKTDSIDQTLDQILNLLFPVTLEEPIISVNWAKHGIMGCSKPMQRLFKRVTRIAPTDATVLLTGESGTGKELFARAIHHLSQRRQNPFLAINCAAIAPSLMEAELFGSRRGAFTDAKKDRKGFFEMCTNGTLMLDEIGEMPLELQAKLLRVLQEREVIPVGSCSTVQVNTRVIAVTNGNLEELVQQGKFRKDLYFRLAVVTLDTPPLRTIKEDIEVIVRYFFQKFNQQFNKTVKLPSPAEFAKLKSYDWPGNIRELHNAVERGILFAENDEIALEDLLPASKLNALAHQESEALALAHQETSFSGMPLHYTEAKKFFEKHYLEALLAATKGVISQAADISGQYRPNLYRMIKKYNIDITAFKGSAGEGEKESTRVAS